MTERPIILIDLDNVVYDFVEAMRQWLLRVNALDRKTAENYTQWAIWLDWNIQKGEFMRWWRLGVEQGEIYGKGPLIPGARKALWELSDAEWDIHIATNRLSKFGLHDQIVINTANWLRSANIPYRNIHFTDNKLAIEAEAIVDDRADNMDDSEKGLHGQAFLFPANHHTWPKKTTENDQYMYWRHIVKTLC